MKHEFIINVRKKYKINRDEALKGEMLYIILCHCDRGNYSTQAMKTLLDDLEKIKYEEFKDYYFKYLDDEYSITTNCLKAYLSGGIGNIITLEDSKEFDERYHDYNFKSVQEFDEYASRSVPFT